MCLCFIPVSSVKCIKWTRQECQKRDIAFWSGGHAVCFFYKDTKVGNDLTLIGKILDDPEELTKVESGDEVSIYCDVDGW